MNQTQRKFLIDKIKETIKTKQKILTDNMMDKPSLSNHIYKAIMEGSLKIQPEEVILKHIKERATKAKEGEDWLTKSKNWYGSSGSMVAIESSFLFELPKEYADEMEKVKSHNEKLQQELYELNISANSLEMRIQLASDKTLQKMINEVDDMGDISLIDMKIKQISN